MSSIDGIGGNNMPAGHTPGSTGGPDSSDDGSFGSVMSDVADAALSGVSRVAPLVPGGELVGMAADGLLALKGSAPDPMPGAADDQMQHMFEMQEQSQAFNLQYLELQQEMQEENRKFSTLTNLMKARHDTAKSAINNMHV